MKLTAGQKKLLQQIADSEDGELVQSIPGGWWIDTDEVSATVAWALLRFALISEVSISTSHLGYHIYRLNESGREALKTGKLPAEILSMLKGHRGYCAS